MMHKTRAYKYAADKGGFCEPYSLAMEQTDGCSSCGPRLYEWSTKRHSVPSQ